MKSKREHKITFRLNDIEFKAMKSNADKAKMQCSEYIRTVLLKGHVIAKFSDEEKIILRNLIGLATNLNQLAHKANANVDFLTPYNRHTTNKKRH